MRADPVPRASQAFEASPCVVTSKLVCHHDHQIDPEGSDLHFTQRFACTTEFTYDIVDQIYAFVVAEHLWLVRLSSSPVLSLIAHNSPCFLPFLKAHRSLHKAASTSRYQVKLSGTCTATSLQPLFEGLLVQQARLFVQTIAPKRFPPPSKRVPTSLAHLPNVCTRLPTTELSCGI